MWQALFTMGEQVRDYRVLAAWASCTSTQQEVPTSRDFAGMILNDRKQCATATTTIYKAATPCDADQ